MSNQPFHVKHRSHFAPEEFHHVVHIVGVGGMGSHIASSLARMGVGNFAHNPIHLWDMDKFEDHNRANQDVTYSLVGSRKVNAVEQRLKSINPKIKVIRRATEVTHASELSGVVFLCLDSMAARIKIMDSMDRNKGIHAVIETRMDSNTGISFCFDPHLSRHRDCWWAYTYPDDETDNVTGCGGYFSIMSAIHGTTMVALRQFEDLARIGTARNLYNRVYMDFDTLYTSTEVWSLNPHWD